MNLQRLGGMTRSSMVMLLILMMLLLPFVGLCSVEAEDSPVGFPLLYKINIMSPSNSTYNSNALVLDVNATTIGGANIYTSISYSLDGASNKTIPLTIEYPAGNTFMMAQHLGAVDLQPLTDGTYKVTVYVTCDYPNNGKYPNEPDRIVAVYNSTVHFTVNANSEQQIPEFQSLIILPLCIIVALAVAIYRKKLTKKATHSY
jgi:hypothetical protein